MPVPRFVFLSRPVVGTAAEVVGGDITWMLVSPNSRLLGRAAAWFPDYDSCRAILPVLQADRDRLKPGVSVTDGRWQWRLTLDGTLMAVSSRSYLRQHECEYNIRRFLEALPTAEIAPTVRMVRNKDAWRIETQS